MTEPTVHALDHPPTLLNTPLKISEAQENNVSCTNDAQGAVIAIISTAHLALERDTTHDSDDELDLTIYVPGPPGEPPPDTNRTPAPPPHETQDEEGLPDVKGITYHSNGTYKVTVKCTNCHRQYKTGWGRHQEPYDELTAIGWTKGRDRSNNYTWQYPRCPAYHTSQGCTGARHPQGLLALQV